MFAVTMSMFYVVVDSLMNQVMVMEKVRIFKYHRIFHVVIFKKQCRFASRLAF